MDNQRGKTELILLLMLAIQFLCALQLLPKYLLSMISWDAKVSDTFLEMLLTNWAVCTCWVRATAATVMEAFAAIKAEVAKVSTSTKRLALIRSCHCWSTAKPELSHQGIVTLPATIRYGGCCKTTNKPNLNWGLRQEDSIHSLQVTMVGPPV